MKKIILLVDDEPPGDFIDLLEEFENCQVTIAETATDALKLLYEKQFQAIIMDIIIPVGEGCDEYFPLSTETSRCPGFKLASLIKEGLFGNIPTIIYSGLVGSFRLRGRLGQLKNDHIFMIAKPDLDDEIIKILAKIE